MSYLSSHLCSFDHKTPPHYSFIELTVPSFAEGYLYKKIKQNSNCKYLRYNTETE